MNTHAGQQTSSMDHCPLTLVQASSFSFLSIKYALYIYERLLLVASVERIQSSI